MKKYILSSLLILTFGFYAVYKSHLDAAVATSEVPVVVDKKVLANANVATGQSIAGAPYREGRYIGPVSDAYYGNVQVGVTVSRGKISAVDFLQYPKEQQNSIRLNQDAIPRLQSEVIAAQNADVDTITGASLTSAAFLDSLSPALAEAKQ